MEVQINSVFVEADTSYSVGAGVVMITPPIDGAYWIMRVQLSDKQAIVCFPKFGTIGIGFQEEKDWNTNLPYTCDVLKIFNHIKHNKGDEAILDDTCILAITDLQNVIRAYVNRD